MPKPPRKRRQPRFGIVVRPVTGGVLGPAKAAPRGRSTSPQNPLESFIDAVRNHRFGEDTCFLCGVHLSGHSHDEDVFPRWLQRRYNLGQQEIHLLNRTTIRYRQLRIPCCSTCNNVHLSRVENQIQRAHDAGFAAFKKLDRFTIFLWVAKIFYGILYRELFLSINRKDPQEGPILDNLKAYNLIHHFIQSFRIPIKFYSADAPFPGTLFLFRLQRPKDPRLWFDFRDNAIYQTVFMRMGTIGILVSFDAGAQFVASKDAFHRFARCGLHPQQFEELGARLFYEASLFNRSPAFLFASGPTGGGSVTVPPIAGMSGRPVFDRGDPTEFAKVLSLFVNVPLERLHPNPTQVMTFLHKPDGRFLRLDLRRFPYCGSH